MNDLATSDTGLGCHFADLPSGQLAPRAQLDFTFHWSDRWEGKDFRVTGAAAA